MDIKNDDFGVDVIVCVHNALDVVKVCLDSLMTKRTMPFHLIIVDDGSDEQTHNYLCAFSQLYPCNLIRNQKAKGYTIAANQGLKRSTAKYCVLLNSDTVVTLYWLEKLIRCMESNKRTGIAGVLSNAASWQSIPEIVDEKGWAVNALGTDMTVEDMSSLVESCSGQKYPKVHLINGFCMIIKREVIDRIGYMDEKNFPAGYGEENDYCLRARAAGFELRIADDCYIYHQKTRSFKQDKAFELRKKANRVIREKHDPDVVQRSVHEMKNHQDLIGMRQKVKEGLRAKKKAKNQRMSVLFLLPVKGGMGGAHSVVQEAMGLKKLDIHVKVATKTQFKDIFLKHYPEAINDCIFFNDDQELVRLSQHFNIVVATIFKSVKLLKKVIHYHKHIKPAYYIQDYEPWFFPENHAMRLEAEASYRLIPGIHAFAKTDWLCGLIQKKHGLKVHKVQPSLDNRLYHPLEKQYRKHESISLAAMIRPGSSRRSPGETMQILKKIKQKFGPTVTISLFGCSNQELSSMHADLNFAFQNYGVLKREEVAKLLQTVDIFIDLSAYQAFGRTGLEAMAVGCSTILPRKGGTREYAVHGENCYLVDARNTGEVMSFVSSLIEDPAIRKKFSENGIQTASHYSIENAVQSEYLYFRKIMGR